ncbi:MAG: NfeD family protein [Flavobacteriales bacterium]|nr:NfeD family protein [Flavobacteriales bacterium]
MEIDLSLFTAEVVWFLIGVGLLLLELIIPGLILVFFGIGAWLTALILLGFDLSLNMQLLIFSLSSVGSLLLLRQSIRKRYMDVSIKGDSDTDSGFIGSQAISLTNIKPGTDGKVEFNGSQWAACANTSIAPRMAVRIIGMKSIKLIVEPIKL